MSWEHNRAVRDCAEFRGGIRFLLFTLCDRASSGPTVVDGKRRGLPKGWLSISVARMMQDTGIQRRPTIDKFLSKLKSAGVIQRKRRRRKASLTFVSLDWLKAHTYDTTKSDTSKGVLDTTKSVTSKCTQSVTSRKHKVLHQDGQDGTLSVPHSSPSDEFSSQDLRQSFGCVAVQGATLVASQRKSKTKSKATSTPLVGLALLEDTDDPE